MITMNIGIRDKITPALQEIQHRLTGRRFISHTTASGGHTLKVQKPAPHKLRLLALIRNKPATIPAARERYVLVGGQRVNVRRARALLVGGVKHPFPAAGSQQRLPPAVIRQARQGVSEFVGEEVLAALKSA